MENAKYYVNMHVTRRFAQKEYFFRSEDDLQEFLEDLTDYEIDSIISMEKKTRRGWINCWDEFID